MITAERIRQLSALPTKTLERLIREEYPEDQIIGSEFLGITNGHQFCYSVTYPDPDYPEPQRTKVFVDYRDGELIADY
jgi:hypothetical protein